MTFLIYLFITTLHKTILIIQIKAKVMVFTILHQNVPNSILHYLAMPCPNFQK